MKRPLVIFSLLALSAGLALAQPPEASEPGDRDTAADNAVSGPGDAVRDPGNSANGTGAPQGESSQSGTEGPAAGTSASGDDSPFDYQASEQISEDLSVSFPIDI